jgi:hypothetical protein
MLHKGLTKICGLYIDDSDDKVLAILWAYRTMYKILTGHTPFKLVYDEESIILNKARMYSQGQALVKLARK